METKANETRFLGTVQQNNNWATYLPALFGGLISDFSKYLNSEQGRGGYKYLDGLRFLDDSYPRAMEYDWALVSAAYTYRKESYNFLTQTSATLVGDSGGYQIAKGVWRADWLNPNDKQAQQYREHSKRFQIRQTNIGTILDIPVLALSQDRGYLIGCETFDDCLKATQINIEYFLKPVSGIDEMYRKGHNFYWLNVLQGSSPADSAYWYQQVKQYSIPNPTRDHCRGWSFAGVNMANIRVTLQRISAIIEDDLLYDWIHFLGTSKLSRATVFSYIQQALRKYHNSNIHISFDSSNPSQAVKYGRQTVGANLQHNSKWRFQVADTVSDTRYRNDARFIDDIIREDQQPESQTASLFGNSLTGSDMCPTMVGHSNDDIARLYQYVNEIAETVYWIQEANRQADKNCFPDEHLWNEWSARDAIDDVFSKSTHAERLHRIDYFQPLWEQFEQVRGITAHDIKDYELEN